MRKILMIFLAPLFVVAGEIKYPSQFDLETDKGIDSFLVVDPFHPIERTKIGFSSFLTAPCGLSYAMVSPRMDLYFNGDFDASLGIGIRRAFKTFILGSHVFLDYSFQRPIPFYQFGKSIEFLTNNFDIRLNYYHPIFSTFFHKKSGFLPEKWVEAEYIAKFKDFYFGIGPLYNFTTDKWAVKPKVVLSCGFFTMEAGVYLSENANEHTSYFSVGIPLYSLGQKPVARNCFVKSMSNVGQKKEFKKKSYQQMQMNSNQLNYQKTLL